MISNVGGARPTYVDRNPVNQSKVYNTAAVAPHGDTQRWVYTVPSGKKARINTVFTRWSRVTAGAPVGNVIAYIQQTPSGGSAGFVAVSEGAENTVRAAKTNALAGVGEFLAGDVLDGHTVD